MSLKYAWEREVLALNRLSGSNESRFWKKIKNKVPYESSIKVYSKGYQGRKISSGILNISDRPGWRKSVSSVCEKLNAKRVKLYKKTKEK